MDQTQQYGTRFNSTAEGASGSATVTRAASPSRVYYVTDISGSNDAATGTVHIRLYSNATDWWKDRVNLSYTKRFQVPIGIPTGSAVSLEVTNRSNTTGSCWVNISGYFIG